MKKITSALFFVLCLSTALNAATSTEKNTLNDKSQNDQVTKEECKKYLGAENYAFINEIFNNEDAALLKCKKELIK